VHARRDRLQHDRAESDRLDEVTVTDVEVEDACARAKQHVDLLAEVGEVRRIQRRLDLHRSDPFAPGHAAARSYDFAPDGTRRRAMKKPLVPWTCGSVSRNSGRRGCAYWGHSAVNGCTSSPLASTIASFSSALTVQTGVDDRPARAHALRGRAQEREL